MDSDLSLFIRDIKRKTGIDIVVFSEGLKFLARTSDSGEILTPTDPAFTGILQDINTGNTYFRFKYKNASLIGYVHGVGSVERIYAELLTDLLESYSGREMQMTQDEYFRSVLLGECNRTQIQNFQKKFAVPDKPCTVLALAVEGANKQDVLSVLQSFAAETDYPVFMEENLFAYVYYGGSRGDYQSVSDFAGFLAQSVTEETGKTPVIGVGLLAKGIFDLPTSYQQALTTVRMCAVMNSKGAVHSFKEYLLLKMLEDLPKFKLSEYLSILLDDSARDIFSDAEMTNTAEEFLENSLNVSETSRKLYLHRNTLMYRLDKIERETGLNIRKFSDAVTFRLVTILFKLVK